MIILNTKSKVLGLEISHGLVLRHKFKLWCQGEQSVTRNKLNMYS